MQHRTTNILYFCFFIILVYLYVAFVLSTYDLL